MVKTIFWMALGAALVFWAMHSPAKAHDTWLDGHKVDPQTKNLCCGENDCKIVPLEHFHATHSGWSMDDTGEIVAYSRVQPSPDGEAWRCRWGGETKCLFMPPMGY
jgi:hypothetical protein